MTWNETHRPRLLTWFHTCEPSGKVHLSMVILKSISSQLVNRVLLPFVTSSMALVLATAAELWTRSLKWPLLEQLCFD